jgi:hypothetical protein
MKHDTRQKIIEGTGQIDNAVTDTTVTQSLFNKLANVCHTHWTFLSNNIGILKARFLRIFLYTRIWQAVENSN